MLGAACVDLLKISREGMLAANRSGAAAQKRVPAHLAPRTRNTLALCPSQRRFDSDLRAATPPPF